MRRLIAVLAVLACGMVSAQSTEPLIFREKVYDFGEIVENRGNADHEFVFTNSSGRPVKIVNVNASCGCTTPGWTKEPILPGKTGFIKASFDPKGRPGFFNKTLTVITDLDANPVVLQIKGNVVNQLSGDTDFTVSAGKLQLKSRTFSMGTVYLNRDPATKQFPILNGGDLPLKFLSVEKPAFVQVEMPAVLDPGQKGVIKVVYDGRAKGTYGFASDNILITTSDPGEEVKSFSLFATLEEFYAPPTAEELLVAPLAMLKESSIDFGQYPPGAILERKVTLYNKGKKELKIKALQGNCTCISAEANKKSIRSGDSTQIRILFKPQTRGGTQQKAITIYTNDPRNPVQLISASVYIND